MQDPIVNLSGSPEVPDLVNANGSARPVFNNVQAEYNPLNDTSLNYISAPTRSYDASSVTMEEAAPFRTGRYNNVLYGYNNEDAAAQRQGWTSKMVNGVGKGLLLTGTTFVQSTAGLLNGVYQMIDDGRFASFYDNDFNRKIDEITKAAEDILPNYYSDAEKNSRWYSPSKLFSANFLWDGIVKNLGFAAGAALSGGVFATGLKSLSLLPGLAKLVSIGKGAEVLAASTEEAVAAAATAGKVAEGYGKLKAISNQFLGSYKTLNAGSRAVVAGLATTGEAGFEAFNNLNQFRDDKIEEYKNTHGGLDPIGAELDKINKASESVGNSSFLANVALLSVTNYIQFPKILGSSYRAEKDIINGVSRKIGEVTTDTTGKFIEKAVTGNKFLSALNKIRPYTFSVPEGFEEGAQYAIQIGTQDYYDKKYDNSATSAIGSIFEGIKETVGTDEGMENILIGGLSGALMLGRGRYKENSAKDINTKAAIESFNKSKLSDFTSDTIDSVNRGTVLQEDREELLKAGKITDSKDKEADYIINYLSPRIKYGRFDLVRSDIAEYRTLASTEEGFAQLQAEGKALASDTREAYLTRLAKFEATAENTKSLYQSLNLRYGGKVDENKKPLYTSAVMDKMVYAAAKVADYDDRLPSVEATLVNAGIDISTVNADLIAGNFESYNAAMEKVKTLDSTIQEDVGEALYSVGQMTVRRNLFLQEYTDIKNNPKEYKEQTIEDLPEVELDEKGEPIKKTITLTTKNVATEFEIGVEYFLGTTVDYETNGINSAIDLHKLKILGENEDGTIKIQTGNKIFDIPKDRLKDYKLTKADVLEKNKTAKFFYEHRNEIYSYNFGKGYGGEKKGRLQYENGKLFFVYIGANGKLLRKDVSDNAYFKAQEGFNKARLTLTGEKALTKEQLAANKAFIEEKKTKEEQETIDENRNKRIVILSDLAKEIVEEQESTEKLIAKKQLELENIIKDLNALEEKILTTENDVDKRIKGRIQFKSATRKMLAAAERLEKMKDDLTKELAFLEARKDELDIDLSYISDSAQYIVELPEGKDDFLQELRDQQKIMEELIDSTEKEIKIIHSVLPKIQDALDQAIAFLSDLLDKFAQKFPKVPTFIMGQEWIDFLKANPNFLKRQPTYKEELKQLEEMVAQVDDLDIVPGERTLQELQDRIAILQQALPEYKKELKAKSAILAKFEAIANKYLQEKEEEDKLAKDEQLIKEALGTEDNDTIIQLPYSHKFEAEAKKADEYVPISTIPLDDTEVPHHIRANKFGILLNKLPNRKKIKGVFITLKNEETLGLKGLMSLLKNDEEGVDESSIIAMVMVEEDKEGNLSLIDENGVKIENATDYLSKGIFTIMPDKLLTSGKMFRESTSKEVKNSIIDQYKKWREKILKVEDLSEVHEINASLGHAMPVTTTDQNGKEVIDYNARVSVEDSEFVSEEEIEGDLLISIPNLNNTHEKGTTSFLTPLGRIFLELPNGYRKLNNKQHSRAEAESIFDTIMQVAKQMMDKSIGIKDPSSVRLVNYLKSVIYWGIPRDPNTKERKPNGYNSIFWEKDSETGQFLLSISGNGKNYPFTPSSLQLNKEQIITLISNMYNNVNSTLVKDLNSEYEQIISISSSGEIKSVIWPNYQTYLLSNKTPDGKKRTDIPLTTNTRPIKTDVEGDTNITGVYFYTTDTADDFVIPISEKPKPVVKSTTPTKPVTKTVVSSIAEEKKAIENKLGIKLNELKGRQGIYGTPEADYNLTIDAMINEGAEGLQAHDLGNGFYTIGFKGKSQNKITFYIFNKNSNSVILSRSLTSSDVWTGVEESYIKKQLGILGITSFSAKEFIEAADLIPSKYNTKATVKLTGGKFILDGKTTNTYTSPKTGLSILFGAPANINESNFMKVISVLQGADLETIFANVSDRVKEANPKFTPKQVTEEAQKLIKRTIYDAIVPQLGKASNMESEEVFVIGEEDEEAEETAIVNVEKKIDEEAFEIPDDEENSDAVNEAINNALKNKNKQKPILREMLEKEIKDIKIENWAEIEEWIKTNFPNLPLYRVKNIISEIGGDRKAWGMLKNGALYIYEQAEVGTVYHEVFEAVWKLISSPEERASIENEFKSRKGTFTDRPTGKTIKYSEATPSQIKEQLAEEFRDYRVNKKIPQKPVDGRPFILKLFSDIVNLVKGWFGKENFSSLTEELFNKINTGGYKNNIPLETALSYASKGIIDIEDAYFTEADELSVVAITDIEKMEIVEEMTYLTLVDLVATDKGLFTLPTLNKTELYSKLKNEILETIANKVVAAYGLVENETLTLKQAKPTIDKYTNLMKLVDKQWESIVAKHEEFLRGYSIEFDENDTLQLTDENNTGRDNYQDATKIDNFKKTNAAIKLLLATMPKVYLDENSEEVAELSSIGGYKLIPMSETYVAIMNNVHTSRGLEEMFSRLRDMAVVNPNYRTLYKRLTKTDWVDKGVDFTKIETTHGLQLISTFWKTFKKQNPSVQNVFILENGEVVVGDANLSTAAAQLKSEYIHSIILFAKEGKGFYKYDKAKKKYVGVPAKVKDIDLNTNEKRVMFLSKLGISFTLKEINSFSKNLNKFQQFKETVDGIKASIANTDEIAMFSGKVLEINNRLLELALLKASLTHPEFDSTYFNVTGDRTQSFIGTNAPSDLYDVLSQIDNLNELKGTQYAYLLTDVFAQGSDVLKRMFKPSGERRTDIGSENLLKVGYVSGIINSVKGKQKQSSKLSYPERIIQGINLNLKGWFLNLIPADATTEWMINMGNPITTSNLSKGMVGVNRIFGEYFKAELALARDKRPLDRHRDKKLAKELRFFKEILGEKLHNDIIAETESIEDVYTKYESRINTALDKYITKKTNNLKWLLERFNILKQEETGWVAENINLPENMTENELNGHLKALSINFIIANIEMHKIIYSDPYQYWDELKRVKPFNSPAQPLVNDPKMNAAYNKVWNKGFNKGDIGYTDFTKPYFSTGTFADVIGIIDLPDYKEYEETNGSGIITFGAYRNFRIRAGEWNDNEEAQYRYDVAWEKNDKGLEFSLEENDILDKGNPMIQSAYTPLKPIARGNKANKRNYNDVVMDKYALYPLSYRMMKSVNKAGSKESSNAITLYNKMQNEKIDYMVFETGRKVGAEQLSPVYDANGNFVTTVYKGIVKIPFEILSIQAEVPSHDDNSVTRGSQITKLITMDYMEAGVPVDFNESEKNFNKRYKTWYALSEDAKKEASPLYKEIINNQNLLEELTQKGYENLLKTLGIKEENGTFTIVDLSKTGEMLRDEILKREVTDNISKALTSFLEGKSVLEATPAYQQIRNILYSIADREVISQKMPGGSKVQIPSLFFEEKRFGLTKIKGKKGYTSDVLRFYSEGENKTNTCEIMIGRWFDSPLSDEELLNYLNNTPEGQKILSGLAYRIPTQKQNSIEAFVIKQFLPKEFGDSVVVPAALVEKTGADFDIDKLFMYLKNVIKGKNGLELVNYLTDTNSTVGKRYYNWVKENVEKDVKKYKNFLSKGAVKELRDAFKNTLDEINNNYKTAVSEKKEELYSQYTELFNDVDYVLNVQMQNNYILELFKAGGKIFRVLPKETKTDYWKLKDSMLINDINGPQEIENYLALTLRKLERNEHPNDTQDLLSMVSLYEEELRVLGATSEYVKEYKEEALRVFREGKNETIQDIGEQSKQISANVKADYYSEKESINVQAAEEMAEIQGLPSLSEFGGFSLNKQNTKKALENAYIESSETLVLHPKNYKRLIQPNSATQLKDLAEEITIKVIGHKFDYTNINNMLDMGFMTRLRHAFVTGKYAIGIAAVNQTNHSLNQRQPIFIDKNKLTLVKEDGHWLGDAEIKFDKYNKITVDGRVVPTLSMIENADGQDISDIIGQFIDGYVDISKGPWIMELGATPNVASTYLFLIKLGVPVDTVAYFMNQPIIQDYLRTIESEGYSWLFIDKYVKAVKGEYASSITIPKEGFTIPSKSALKNLVGKKVANMNSSELVNQRLILDEFLKYAKMAEHMFLVTQGSNFDTATFNDPYLVFKKFKQLEKAQSTIISSVDKDGNIISGVDGLLDNSFIGALKTRIESLRDALAEILKSDQPRVRGIIEKVITPYIQMNDNDFVKLAQKAVNDLFDYALQTDTALNEEITDLLIKNGGAAKEVGTFIQHVKDHKGHSLHNNVVINLMQIVPSDKAGNASVTNVKVKSLQNKVYDQNNLIFAFREIRDYLKSQDSKLYDRLIRLAVLQSGLSKSTLSFTSVIPFEDFEEIYNETLSSLEKIPNLEQFYELGVFQRNNWNNDDVVPHVKAKYIKYKTEGGKYNPSMAFLPDNVKKATTAGNIPQMLTQSTLTKEAKSDFIVYSWEDISISNKDKKQGLSTIAKKKAYMRKIGDFSYIQKGLFQKVYDDFGTALIHRDYKGTEYFVYKATNAWGNGNKANEFYTEDRQSVIDNGFIKVESNPHDNHDIIDLFLDYAAKNDRKNPNKSLPLYENKTNMENPQYEGMPLFNALPSKSNTPTMTYAGVGSRQTPENVLSQMTEIATELESKGYTLNTGVTFYGKKEGADKAFDDGTKKKNLFSPEKQGSRAKEQAIAKEIHPAPEYLKGGGLKLMARNTNQVFGDNLNAPVDFVLFYAKETKGIRPEGGTGQAVEMARRKNIPTINMANPNWRQELDKVLSNSNSVNKPKQIGMGVAEEVYSKLGNKTVSENVKIVDKPYLYSDEQKRGKAIVAYKSTKMPVSFENPFHTSGKTTKENVIDFIDFFLNSNEPQAVWMRAKAMSGEFKGKPIYYGNTQANKENQPSHATAIDYLINKYDWNTNEIENVIAKKTVESKKCN
jgi:hypothetical protein